jgi:hypothetical protein
VGPESISKVDVDGGITLACRIHMEGTGTASRPRARFGISGTEYSGFVATVIVN